MLYLDDVDPLKLPVLKFTEFLPTSKFEGLLFMTALDRVVYVSVIKTKKRACGIRLLQNAGGSRILSECRKKYQFDLRLRVLDLCQKSLSHTDLKILREQAVQHFSPEVNVRPVSKPLTCKPSQASEKNGVVIKLVDSTQKQQAWFEICDVIHVPPGSRGWVHVGLWRIERSDLKRFGIAPRSGVSVNLKVQRSIKSFSAVCILERLDDNLRLLSDMRNKPAWRQLPWLEPAIDAIYAERDRLTRETGIEHHVDHIHPVNSSRICGLTVPWNLQVIPAVENLRKSNKLIAS